MDNLKCLIAAGGRGSRSGLPFPKTLYPVQGIPILARIISLFAPYDAAPTVISSPSGRGAIQDLLTSFGVASEIIEQDQPRGMGDAVLQFHRSLSYQKAEHIVLIWGDIPLIHPSTLEETLRIHFKNKNDFTFPTREVTSPYTLVVRDESGNLKSVSETRETGAASPTCGERDIGLFVFRIEPVFSFLRRDLPGKYGKTTGEHGFLYIIEHLIIAGKRVEALPIALKEDLISLNSLSDLDGI